MVPIIFIGTTFLIHMNIIKKFLEKNANSKICINVIGDPIIDEYYDVSVNRISPEFPIPVYKSVNENSVSGIVPGGAANVAFQFKHFNVNLELICLLSSLSQIIYDSRGIKTNYSKIVGNMSIPTKKRIYSQNIPLCRWDLERENFGLDDIKKHLLDLNIPDSDINIFSDYNKGMFSYPWFRKFFKNSKSIVDPKNNNIDLWQDCTIFKPNSIEAKQFSDRKNWHDQIDYFMNSLRCDSVVITQGGQGVVAKELDYFEYKSKNSFSDPRSVIGAGDCFCSFLAMAVARGFNLQEACEIAFEAGAIYVKRDLNKPVSPAELWLATGSKIVTCPEILANRNFKLSFTNGCFDLLHGGHLSSLKYASQQGEKLCVAINSDESVKKIKGENRPIMQLHDRLSILENLEFVDYIIVFDDETPIEIIKSIEPDVIVKGAEYENKAVIGREFCKEVRFAPTYGNMSTTNIIAKIKFQQE